MRLAASSPKQNTVQTTNYICQPDRDRPAGWAQKQKAAYRASNPRILKTLFTMVMQLPIKLKRHPHSDMQHVFLSQTVSRTIFSGNAVHHIHCCYHHIRQTALVNHLRLELHPQLVQSHFQTQQQHKTYQMLCH